jgi:hypothetical protein
MPRPSRIAASTVLALIVLVSGAAALGQDAPSRPPTTFIGFTLGSYQVSDPVFEEVYGGAARIFGFTASQRIFGVANFDLSAVLDVRRLSKAGFSTLSQTETLFKLAPWSLGIEASLSRGIVFLWFGSGLDLVSYDETSDLQTISGSTLGFHVAGGIGLQPVRSFPLRLKLRLGWTKAKTMENEIPVELGGAEFGAGLIFGFRLF